MVNSLAHERLIIMGKLIYLITTSLDGFVADNDGNFSWAKPTEEVHSFINDQLCNVGTILMGSKLYETMKVWEDIPTEGVGGFMEGPSQPVNDYARIWHNAKKIIYSKTLNEVTIANTTIERTFDPANIKKIVARSEKDFDIGGPHLAVQAIKADIVDEIHQIIVPVLIGSGNYWLPTGAKSTFKVADLRQFDNGSVYLRLNKT